jgi:ABC-type multidrug transport system ATPase subunit
MRQRASLARVLMLEPDLLLLDEPFSNMDAASVQAMIERLRAFLAQPGRDGVTRTLFVTTHQADLARPLATTTLVLMAGQLTTRTGVPSEPARSIAATEEQ